MDAQRTNIAGLVMLGPLPGTVENHMCTVGNPVSGACRNASSTGARSCSSILHVCAIAGSRCVFGQELAVALGLREEETVNHDITRRIDEASLVTDGSRIR